MAVSEVYSNRTAYCVLIMSKQFGNICRLYDRVTASKY